MIAKSGYNTVTIGSSEGHGICKLTGVVARKIKVEMFSEGNCERLRLGQKGLCHVNTKKIEQVIRLGAVEGLGKAKSSLCQECCDGKQTEVPHPRCDKRQREVLESIHSAIMASTRVPSLTGSR